MQYTETTPRQKVTNKVLDQMMVFAGHTLYYDEYLKLQDNEKNKYKISQKAIEVWSNWAVQLVQKELKCSLYEAEIELSWIQHNFGLSQYE